MESVFIFPDLLPWKALMIYPSLTMIFNEYYMRILGLKELSARYFSTSTWKSLNTGSMLFKLSSVSRGRVF